MIAFTADELQAYERILPGSAERIIALSESELNHRIELEKMIADRKHKQACMWQIIITIVGALGIVSGSLIGIYGNQFLGSLIGGGSLVLAYLLLIPPKKLTKGR